MVWIVICPACVSFYACIALLLAPQVDVRVGEAAPTRPVAEKAWLKPTGMLPLGNDPGSSFVPMYDVRDFATGGCDSPAHLDGCHVYYIKVRSRRCC